MQKVKNSKVSVFIKVLLLSVVLYGCSAQSKRTSENNFLTLKMSGKEI